MLKFEKFNHEFGSMIKYVLGERILFSINPQIWESLLSTVENFCQIWELSFFIKNFISLGKVWSIISTYGFSLINCTEILDMIEVLLTNILALWGVKIELIITFMH